MNSLLLRWVLSLSSTSVSSFWITSPLRWRWDFLLLLPQFFLLYLSWKFAPTRLVLPSTSFFLSLGGWLSSAAVWLLRSSNPQEPGLTISSTWLLLSFCLPPFAVCLQRCFSLLEIPHTQFQEGPTWWYCLFIYGSDPKCSSPHARHVCWFSVSNCLHSISLCCEGSPDLQNLPFSKLQECSGREEIVGGKSMLPPPPRGVMYDSIRYIYLRQQASLRLWAFPHWLFPHTSFIGCFHYFCDVTIGFFPLTPQRFFLVTGQLHLTALFSISQICTTFHEFQVSASCEQSGGLSHWRWRGSLLALHCNFFVCFFNLLCGVYQRPVSLCPPPMQNFPRRPLSLASWAQPGASLLQQPAPPEIGDVETETTMQFLGGWEEKRQHLETGGFQLGKLCLLIFQPGRLTRGWGNNPLLYLKLIWFDWISLENRTTTTMEVGEDEKTQKF